MADQREATRRRLEDAGAKFQEQWDYPTARALAVRGLAELRTKQPDLYSMIRRFAFDMRHELHENLAGIPEQVVEQVTLTLLAKVVPLAAVALPDPRPLLSACEIATFAVLPEPWEVPGG